VKITKAKKSYNDYNVEGLSFGQLEAIRDALGQNHHEVLLDELYSEWCWYCDKLPSPGEDEDELKEKQEQAQGGGKEGAVEGEDIPIPMPPGSEVGTPPDDGSGERPTPPEDGEDMGNPEPRGLKILKGEERAPQRGLPEPGMDGEDLQPGQPPAGAEADGVEHRLPPPPRE
jgi:hypothetical protein